MECSICKTEIKEIPDGKVRAHLLGLKGKDGHIHIHGDLSNREDLREILLAQSEDLGIPLVRQALEKKEIVFHNRQRIGDMIMFTCAVRDFKKAFPDVRVNVISTCGHLWDNNPYVDRSLTATPENTIKIGPSKLTNASNRLDWHFANAFRVSIEDELGIYIPQGESRGDLWITDEEWHAPRMIKDPYWIICITGEKGWGCKMYPFDKWQAFISQNPDIKFVQVGAKEDNPPRLQGANVIDYVGKTQDKESGIRDLIKLFLNAEGSIGLVSFHMHLSAALYKPAIVIAGAREPVSFTRYQGHAYLNREGMLKCAETTACWKCAIDGCSQLVIKGDQKIPRCVDLIPPEEITAALNMYYEGGRLKKGIPSEKPYRFKNIVKAQIKEKKADIKKYGMEWGGGCITSDDWDFIRKVIKDNNIKRVLEFGSGLSTLLMNEAGLEVETYETNEGWIDKLKAINPDIHINLWNGKELLVFEERRFDLAFVDGPAGGSTREVSTMIGAAMADIVIVHDANREWERKWQDKYIKDKFTGPAKGGNRCHLWIRRKEPSQTAIAQPGANPQGKQAILKEDAKLIKMISTARGWGGCARSVTTIMKRLIKEGHRVEFIPFRNRVSSREYQECLAKEIPEVSVRTDYAAIKEPCDIMVVYADDFVWEFAQPEIQDAFSDIKAKRKVMIVNYRRGGIGEIPWTKNWDLYLFLNSTQEREVLKVHPEAKTKVLAPCTELDDFLSVQPNYNNNIRIVRHSSQGDTKFDKENEAKLVLEILECRPDIDIKMIPGPSFIPESDRFKKSKRTSDPREIAKFLSQGNIFWYSLPAGYMDMGPRVILEAMAAGLPVIADNWGGAADRVTPETGWLCDFKHQHVEIFKHLTFEDLRAKGEAAKQRARDEFVPENWIKYICHD